MFMLWFKRPSLREDLGLLQNGLGGLFLLIRRIAMPPENALHVYAKLCANVLAYCPINCDVLPNCVDQLPCDQAQRVIPQNCDRTIVGLQSVIEGQFVVREA